jgi:nicotinamide-nucleotide adenylyltransferase
MKAGKPSAVKVKRGLFVGRFQPYHVGHHAAIKRILKEVDELVIVIGSSKESYTMENPFTSGERVEMINLALREEGLNGRCHIIPVEDIYENALWVSRVISFCPAFEVTYTNNPLVKQLFEDTGFGVRKVISKNGKVESSRIRNAMMKGKSWEKHVPAVVAEYLKSIKATRRINAIVAEEKKE